MPNTGKQSKPPKHAPDAVATQWGWLHKKTGEHLVSVRDLPNQQTGYKPNARPQATPPEGSPGGRGVGGSGHSPAPPRTGRSTRSGGGTVQPGNTPSPEDEERSIP